MVQQDDDEDPWNLDVIQGVPTPDDRPLLSVETIENIEPLDDQFWGQEPKTVPEALYEQLFGQPAPTEAEILAAGGNAEDVPPMQTYAILDAAKVFALVETLKASGLEHRCLFKGDAYDELKDVAPWIVRLEENNKFTRHLFTAGKAPWYLWGKDPGIYVRSRATLEDMWRHFRKFTKVQDAQGKWYYFRFWEGFHLLEFLSRTHNDNVVSFWKGNLWSVIALHNGRCACVKMALIDAGQKKGDAIAKFKLTNRDMHIFAETQLGRFAQSMAGWLEDAYGIPKPIPKEKTLEFLKGEIHIARNKIGLQNEKTISEYVASSWLLGKTAYTAPELSHMSFGTHYDSIRKIHEYSYKLRKDQND